MSNPRPIPIFRDQRGNMSAPREINARNPPASRGGHVNSDDFSTISQSCPVENGHPMTMMSSSYQPPRAPLIGSLPEPTARTTNPMPQLFLPPPAQRNEPEEAPRTSVIQFATSCPVNFSFLSQHSISQVDRSRDETDLSKSPSLQVMSAMRERGSNYRSASQDFSKRLPLTNRAPPLRQRNSEDVQKASNSMESLDIDDDSNGVFHFEEL